ncbi:hypothetical protein FN846DRAFT_892067 [Sphaerosporella brunnea]|uniref:PH domain-containing protein n=1 Tax=Sphaerosporella brunnea TaxID=1250544 RepID=A0A5J5ERJ4_9PEZI|nr:hypothetical protein FN846DRAFT_892067 [Sphaerosporella brunnea]
MSSGMDDPFTTPKHVREPPALDFDSPPILTRPNTSPEQLKRTLQAHLAETRKRLDGAGQLGRDLVKQEEEIEARLKELEECGGRIDPELKRKLAELEKEYNEVGRETARALLTNKIMGGASPHAPPSSQGTSSPSKPAATQTRRQRNQPPSRHHDLEFAAELGQGLIAEVRKLQALLSEREETLKVVQMEKSRLEQHAETIETRLRSLDDSEQRYKEENWNLELAIQELHAQQSEHKETETRMQTTIAQLEYEKTMVIKELDDMKAQFTKVSDELEAKTKQDETEIGSLRRALATTDTEKGQLSKKVEELKLELDEAQKQNLRLRILSERQAEEEKSDGFNLEPEDDDSPDHSPPPSPTKHTQRHGQLEAETLKSSLNHAHRLIQNLRSGLHREKAEKNDLKRLLQEARDELEGARGFSSPSQKEKRRRPDGTFKKLPRPSVALLGIARKSRDEVVAESPISPLGDDEWEETPEDDGEFGRTPGAYVSSVPPTDIEEGDTSFETANERDSTDVFDTATENEHDATETEAYRTGAETPANDGPTSADDLTETESRSRRLRPKASHLSSRSMRPLRLQKLRQQRSSIVSTASTEDDDGYDDRFFSYPGSNMDESDGMLTPDSREYDEEYLQKTPEALANPRLKLRLNRAWGKVPQRMASGNSMFNSNVFSPGSPASFNSPSSMDASPRNPSFRSSTVPNISKSLFAELGSSPGMMSTDGDEDVYSSLSKKLSPSLMPRGMVEMVDCGVMTEEPYPDIPILLDDSASDVASDRPSTAVTVVNDFGMLGVGAIFDRKPFLEPTPPMPEMSDAGVQSDEEAKPVLHDMGIQSEEIPAPAMSEIGTQSDEEPAMVTSDAGTQFVVLATEMGTQSDEEPVPIVTEIGTQSDDEPLPLVAEMGTQSDEEPVPGTTEIGTQSDEEPLPLVTEMGTQSDEEFVPVVAEMGTQYDEEPALAVSETGTQFDTELEAPVVPILEPVKLSDSGTQFDPELEKVEIEAPVFAIVQGEAVATEPVQEEEPEQAIVTVVPTAHVEEAPAFELVKGESLETTPVEVETPVFSVVKGESLETTPVEPVKVQLVLEFADIVAESTEPVSPVLSTPPVVSVPKPVDFSEIIAQSTEPVSPVLPPPPIVLSAPAVSIMTAAPVADAAVSSDEDTPKKVSESIDESPPRPTTPTPSERKRGFFSSFFGSRSKQTTPTKEQTLGTKKSFSGSKNSLILVSDEEVDDTVRQKEASTRPRLNFTASVAESSVQTDLSSDFFTQKEPQIPQRPVLIGTGTMTEPTIIATTPSLHSTTSFESVGPSRSKMGAEGVRLVSAESSLIRPESSSSMRQLRMPYPPLPENHQEHIAAAQQKFGGAHEQTSMGPPPVPTLRGSAFRPRTPAQYDQSRLAETPASTLHAGSTTPKPVPKISATRSEVSSPGSRRSSLSSFATELDDRFNMQHDGYPTRNGDSQQSSTDPRVIQAITQTMIGEYLWKYTRNTGRGTMSHTRHKRFFWIHPYTRTLYWSDRDPQSAGRAELRAKSVAIEAVRVVTDDNPMPPGLHRKSLVIITPGRTLKFTAPTSQRHETWFSALSYLLLRDGQDGIVDDTAPLNDDDMREYAPQGGYSTESSLRPTVRGASSFSSFRSRTTREASPVRNASSLSTRRPADREKTQGSLSRLGNIFRPAAGFGSYSSRNDNSVYGISENGNSEEDIPRDQEMEIDRMENVRACCDGLFLMFYCLNRY